MLLRWLRGLRIALQATRLAWQNIVPLLRRSYSPPRPLRQRLQHLTLTFQLLSRTLSSIRSGLKHYG